MRRMKKKVKSMNQMLLFLVTKMQDAMQADILILEVLMLNLIGLLSVLVREDLVLVPEISQIMKLKHTWMLGQNFNKSLVTVVKHLGKLPEATMNLLVTPPNSLMLSRM
jgi:hypothetical protein